MATEKKATTQEVKIEIPGIQLATATIVVQGDSPLISHKWSEKAKKQMLDKQQKKASQAKEAKDPQADYEATIYYRPDGTYGFPAIGFKAAAVGACRYVDGLEKRFTFIRGAFHINEELCLIEGEPQMREDMVRVGMGTADLRYRAEFPEWKAYLPVSFNSRAVSLEQLVNLFNVGGFGVGVGEWRPEKDGSFGRFHVLSAE